MRYRFEDSDMLDFRAGYDMQGGQQWQFLEDCMQDLVMQFCHALTPNMVDE